MMIFSQQENRNTVAPPVAQLSPVDHVLVKVNNYVRHEVFWKKGKEIERGANI